MTDTAADQLRRILHLIPALADDAEHSMDEVATRLGIDRATLVRDLHSLAERYDDPGGFVEGVQIYLGGSTVSLRSNHFLRPMRLTIAELGALELGLALLAGERAPDDRPLLDGVRQLLRQVLARLPDDPPAPDAIVASTGTSADGIHLGLFRRAMRERRKVHLAYRGSGTHGRSERTVCPYASALASGAWYLVAHCERSGGIRVFRVDRVESAALLEERYAMPDDFELDEIVRDGRVFAGTPAETARVRYAPAVARWVAEREGRVADPDGSITVTYPLADPDWVVRHVLQYGADAEVLEPEHARAAVRARLATLLAES